MTFESGDSEQSARSTIEISRRSSEFSRNFNSSKPKRRKRRWIPILVILVVLLMILGSYNYYSDQVNGSNSGSKVTIQATPGEGLSQLSSSLAAKGVIGSSFIFKLWLRSQSSITLQTGTYEFLKNESFARVLATISQGPVLDKLVIPGGLTLEQIAARVGRIPGHTAKHFLEVANSGQIRSPFEPSSVNSLEGLLYPDTYSFDPSTSDKTILQMMIDAFVTEAHKLGLTPSTKINGLSSYQAIVMASIIEKEAVYPGDGNKVARVILNRLSDNMKLQLDSTVFYALNNGSSHLSLSDLNVSSPYNTYIHTGLPPTPIATVSEGSLDEALHPAVGNWLYYVVVQKDGQEAFSSTYADQLANEAIAKSRGLG